MFSKLLTLLSVVAAVVASIYAVISYHRPPPKADSAGQNSVERVTTSKDKGRSGPEIIIQRTDGTNSPAIIGDGNVVNSR
jgi:hypothetical protein